MRYKYVPPTKRKPTETRGKQPSPNTWLSGPCPIQHDKYYAWLKHRSQAHFRNEAHELTWEDWQQLWPNDLFEQRGRKKTDLCLARIDQEGSWSIENCAVVERSTHLQRNSEFRKKKHG